MITTKILTDPKPATPLDRHGNPMREGYDYYGNPITPQDAVSRAVDAPVARPDDLGVSGVRKRRRQSHWTKEKRAEASAKIKAFWAAKRATTSDNRPNVKPISVEPETLTQDAPK